MRMYTFERVEKRWRMRLISSWPKIMGKCSTFNYINTIKIRQSPLRVPVHNFELCTTF